MVGWGWRVVGWAVFEGGVGGIGVVEEGVDNLVGRSSLRVLVGL